MRSSNPCLGALAAALLILQAGRALAADITKLYFNRATWQNMDWANADQSKIWNGPGWEDFRGKQSETTNFTKRQDIVVQGIDLQANLVYDVRKHAYFTSVYTAVDGIDQTGCKTLIAYSTKQFGKPVAVNEDIHVPVGQDAFYVMTDQVYQWDIGKTRISASCNGSASIADGKVSDEKVSIWSIRFDPAASTPKLEPRIALLCERTMHKDGKETKFKDQSLIIDTYFDRALDLNLTPISKQDTFRQSESEFKFTQDIPDGIVLKYAINRLSGSLLVDAEKGGARIGQVVGSCQKIEKLEKKF